MLGKRYLDTRVSLAEVLDAVSQDCDLETSRACVALALPELLDDCRLAGVLYGHGWASVTANQADRIRMADRPRVGVVWDSNALLFLIFND